MIRASTIRPPVLLATCQARISTSNGEYDSVRLLLDPGSELSFISEEVVRRLRLVRSSASIPLLEIGGISSGRTRGKVTVKLYAIHSPSLFCTIQAHILPQLTCKLPSFTVTSNTTTHIHRLQLADPEYNNPGPIDMIIGSDFYGQIILLDLIPANPPSPLAQLTIFGWVLSGPVSTSEVTSSATTQHCSVNQNLQDLLRRFWIQEEIPSSANSHLSPKKTLCETHFKSTHFRDPEGRYIVKLPLKSPVSSLGDFSQQALRSLSRLNNRLLSNPAYRERYTAFVQEYESLGHMSLIPDSEIEASPIFYLSHHGVHREQNHTTKLRVVFNGSSRTSSEVSLNNILHSGPKLQSDISEVLL